jgi:hypothetical protein
MHIAYQRGDASTPAVRQVLKFYADPIYANARGIDNAVKAGEKGGGKESIGELIGRYMQPRQPHQAENNPTGGSGE